MKINNFNIRIYKAAILGGLFIAVLSLGVFYTSQADALRLTLKRIVFEGTKRTEVITIINNEAEPKTYRLGWRTMKMSEERALEFVEDGQTIEGLQGVESMIRFAPRRVTIPPGGTQQVRIMLRKPRDLAEGEYRSHFWIEPEADAVKFGEEREEGKSAVVLQMLTGITLPVIVRQGNTSAQAEIVEPSATIQGDRIIVNFVLKREGNRSLYGDVDMVCTGGGQANIRTVRGIAVYTEVQRRKVKLSMPVPADVSSCNTIDIIYREPLDSGGSDVRTLAKSSVNL